MSKIKNYRDLSPLNADALVGVVNKALSTKELQEFTKRTLRFYISQKIVPSAIGPAKFARYNYEHLLTVLAARILQNKGYKLDEIRQELKEVKDGIYGRVEALVDHWFEKIDAKVYIVKESNQAYEITKKKNPILLGELIHKVRLTPNTYLSFTDNVDIELELELSKKRIEKILKQLQTTGDIEKLLS